MSPVYGREALEAMKRVDIQKLCKDYGVRANLKTEALIDLLLDAFQPPPRRNPPQAPQRPPSTRISSLTGTKHRGPSTGSVIIHSLDDDTGPRQPVSQEHLAPQRTRKAKQTQYKLGVGRPAIAGGSGARAVTKSGSVSRTPKRTRSSKSIKPAETAITEEPESGGVRQIPSHLERNSEPATIQRQPVLCSVAGPSSEVMHGVIAEVLVPVRQELESHKAQLTDLKEKVSSLMESFETKIRNLTTEIQDLRARAKSSPDSLLETVQEYSVRIPEPPSTPKRVRTPYLPSFALPPAESLDARNLSSNPSDFEAPVPSDSQYPDEVEQHRQTSALLPGFPHSVLGKRPRDSISNVTPEASGVGQEGMETEPESNNGRPPHKRVKMHEPEGMSRKTPLPSEVSQTESSNPPEAPGRPGGSSFTVFRGEDPPPPIERIQSFYAATSPPIMSAPATSSANNIENQNPFNFTFVPIASTPAQTGYPLAMGTFPHPEPPTSPSPAPNPDRPGSRHSDRFGAFGAPRSSSRTSGRATSGGSQARGEAGGSNNLQRAPSSNEIASGLGLTAIKTSATEQGTPVPPAKRTMYGTELEGDTRFGDFGVEGVASGFWASGRF